MQEDNLFQGLGPSVEIKNDSDDSSRDSIFDTVEGEEEICP